MQNVMLYLVIILIKLSHYALETLFTKLIHIRSSRLKRLVTVLF